MSWKIIPLKSFEKELKYLFRKYPSLIQDVRELEKILLQNPQQGIPLGKDLFKVRMAISSKSQGKSGGARVITCLKIVNETIYLVAIYDKSDSENISDDELKERLKEIG